MVNSMKAELQCIPKMKDTIAMLKEDITALNKNCRQSSEKR